MKTIDFKLSKKLNDLGLLDNIETEYKIKEGGQIVNNLQNELLYAFDNMHRYTKFYKTLTLEEAIEFIINNLKLEFKNQISLQVFFRKDGIHYYISGIGEGIGRTQIEAIEKMLELLINNGLLNKN